MQNSEIPVDICVGNMSAYLNSIAQVGFKKNDFTGALGRSLTKGLDAVQDCGRLLARESSRGRVVAHVSHHAYERRVDGNPVGQAAAVSAGGFRGPRDVPANPRETVAAAGPGHSIMRWCSSGTPRTACRTNSSAPAVRRHASPPRRTSPRCPSSSPRKALEERRAGITGLACANGCTIALPAISQRVLYYQVLYRDAANQVVATGRTELIVTP